MARGGVGIRVRRLGGDRAGEIRLTRFLRNASVTSKAMIEAAGVRTAERCRGRRVLAIQDTTVVRSRGGGGLYLHAVVAVDAETDAILGLIDGTFLNRTKGKRGTRKDRPITDKESQRWLDGATRAGEVCAGADRITMVADRESDIFEAFALRPHGVELVVRAAHDRSLGDGGRLFAMLDGRDEAGRVEIDLPARPGRRARAARLAVRFAPVALNRPSRPKGGPELPGAVELMVVDVRELDAPRGAKPIHWRLLTTQPVTDLAAALAIVDLYRRRWAIEQLFRTLKTRGFDVEGLLIEDEAPRVKLITAALIAAVTIQQLVHARDGTAAGGAIRPALDAFDADDIPLLEAYSDRLEGKTERQKNQHPKGSLAHAAWVCARLGGWNCYYGKPGPITMLNGYIHFQAAKEGAQLSVNCQDV